MKKNKKLPGMFWVFIGFLPWIFSWTLSGTRGVATGLIAAAVLNAVRLRSRNFKVLEVVTLAYFATHLLFSMVLGSSFFSDYGRILSGIALAGVAWGSLLAGSPFTYQYAREDWDEVYWDDPCFRLINQIITAVWGMVFTVRVVLEIAAVITVFSDGARLWLLTVLPHAGLVLAILFSNCFPNWFVRMGIKKYLANREPYKWPLPIFPESHASEPDRHDVIVIGSGVGGLTAASLLARRGRKVAVFEQHSLAGGYCTSWVRHVKQGDKKGRYVFDAGVHDVSGLGEQGPVRNLLRRLDIEAGILWHPMYHEYHLGGLHLKIPSDPEGFPRALTALFPHEQDGIAEFLDEMHHVYHEMYADVSRTGGIPREPGTVEALLKYPETHPHFFQWQDVPFIKMLNRYFKDVRLKEFLSVLTGYLCDDPTALTVGAMAPIFGYYFDGGYYPAGGSQSFADLLVKVIEDHSGQVRRHAPVRRIMVENGRATGVELADGQRHRAEAIISNADVKKTFLDLVGSEHLPEEFARQMETLRPSTSAFLVSLGLDFVPGIAPMTVTDEIGIAAPSIADPTLAPPGHAAIQLLRFVSQDEAPSWDRQAPNYAQRKHERGDAMIAAAEKVIPDIRSHIIYRQDSSPCTFDRYTRATGGAIYGPAAGQTLPPLKTPIERLYLAGSGTACGPGIEAVVITGTLVADTISPEPRTAIDSINREPVTRRPSVALLVATLLFAGTSLFAADNTSDRMLVPFPIYSPETKLAITLTAMHTHRIPESKHPSSVMLSGAYSELNQINVSLTTERALVKGRFWLSGYS